MMKACQHGFINELCIITLASDFSGYAPGTQSLTRLTDSSVSCVLLTRGH